MINDYGSDTGKKYAMHNYSGTVYLGLKSVESLITSHFKNHNIKVCDYGCGAGGSTRFLKGLDLGGLHLEIEGFDISTAMLSQAKEQDPDGAYQLIVNNKVPAADNTYDLIFCSFVFFELGTTELIHTVLLEMQRILKPDGYVLIITGTTAIYEPNNKWVSYDANFPENENLKSGDQAKIILKDVDLVLHDYYWTKENYAAFFAHANLSIVEERLPVVAPGDPEEDWQDEREKAPFINYLLKSV